MADGAAGDERVLVDPLLDDRLAADGIVTVPMLGPDELRAVEAAYWDLVPPGEDGIRLDYLREDRDLVRATSELLTSMWERAVPEVFVRHYPVYSSFVVKYPGDDSSLFLHRDLYVDDERHRRTFAMWMPFVDTAPELDNGPLSFVLGSQAIDHGGFGPNAAVLFSPYQRHLSEQLTPLSVPAGSALVYDARMLHASAPNRTDRARLAVGCLVARRDQPVIQVVATGRRHRRVHEVDPAYFAAHRPEDIARCGMPDCYPVLEEYDEDPPITAADVLGPTLAPADLEREVLVPGDLTELAGDRLPLAVEHGPAAGHDHDLDIAAGDLPPIGPSVAGGVAAAPRRDVGALDLVAGWRTVGTLPAAVPDVIVPLGPPRTRDAGLVVIGPEGRVALTAPAVRSRRHEVVVIECTPVRAGACAADRVAELDLGLRIPLPADEPVHVWNDGPGPAVLLVRSTPALRRPRPEGRRIEAS